MTGAASPAATPDWEKITGDIWADHWRETDAALEGVEAALVAAVKAVAPEGPFRAFDIGCGAGTTALAVADKVPGASIAACDISPALAAIARQRAEGRNNIRIIVGDAVEAAAAEAPVDLFFSRHGVMFFADPPAAFRAFRSAAAPGAPLVFSCFRDWESNPWASELARAAAGGAIPAPGREPSGFAFADPAYVRGILSSSGWAPAEPQAVNFTYVAGGGDEAVERALSFMSQLGPAARVLQSLSEREADRALARMRQVIEQHFDGAAVAFPAAAWIWQARARTT